MSEPKKRKVRVLLELVVREYTAAELVAEREGTDLEEEDVGSDLSEIEASEIGEALENCFYDTEVFAGTGIYLKIENIRAVESYFTWETKL